MKKVGITVLLLISFICVTGCHRGGSPQTGIKKSPEINVQSAEQSGEGGQFETNGQEISETLSPEDEIPGKPSPDLILDGVVAWAESDLGLSQTGAYDLDYQDENISSDRAIMLEDGSIIGYFAYADRQSVQATEAGDVVYGEGVDAAKKIIFEEANKTGKKSYIDSMENWAFFIITDDPDDLVGYYMNCKMGNIPD